MKKNVKCHTDRWVRLIDFILRHTWLYLYSTRTMGATVLSQEEKNLGEGSEGSIIVIMTSDDSQKTHR